jgi:hypothetical protein
MLRAMTTPGASNERDGRQGAVLRVFNRIQAMKDRPEGERGVPVPGDELFLDPFALDGASSR